MAISFKSVGHFFAKAFTAIKNDEPKLEAGLAKVEGTASVVETVSAALPGGALVVTAEKLAFACFGELSSILTTGDAAAKAKLGDAGMDVSVITEIEEFLKTVPQVVSIAKAL